MVTTDSAPTDVRVDRWSSPTTILAGTNALSSLQQLVTGATVLILDDALSGSEAAERTRRALRPVAEIGVPAAAGDETIATVSRVLSGQLSATPVALGGGSILDTVRLACLAQDHPGLRASLATAGAGPLVWPIGSVSRVVAIPATIGTAAEVSPVAIRPLDSGVTMVVSPALRARAAVLDPAVTAGLPVEMALRGLLETWARVVVPAVCGDPLRPQDDLAAALRSTTEDLAADVGEGLHRSDWRLSAALTATSSHTAFLALGRAPAGHLLWPVATEWAAAAGCTKAAALALLLPAWLRLIASGSLGPAFGDEHRVRRILGADATICAGHLAEWSRTIRPTPATTGSVDVHAVVQAVRDRWQGPLFLSSVAAADLRTLCSAAADTPAG